MGPDYFGLLAGYAAAIAVFWAIFLVLKPAFLRPEPVQIARPWLELGVLALGVAAVLGVGQLYVRGLLLPEEGELFQSLNQLAIFAPALLVLALQCPAPGKNGWRKNFLPLEGAAGGLALGVALALVAFTAFVAARHGLPQWTPLGRQLLIPDNISLAVQILLEDILIAALAARFLAATNVAATIILVAVLFAAAHIPAMLAEGASLDDLSSLLLDTGLGVMLIGAIIVSRNVWWFWPLHTVMDLTQFLRAD